ncbi:hypothetical protein ASPWEDRAFT_34283 [Aspergillus wentii DTO 134E9]|uniref:N-acetyltransferase domain-containing protein n=1 Tax=Aspergillus wentii DTO 134E9 TaxID=1073089 RepID=A0A1L9S0V5_ASPWE|nr:uncharacterized protein ASPWEDRAFT_34283 [Aspergillus wentii DTO 134E9]KAI9931192.1 hypothetical protein MW887_010852 [Aspergillus wentii]OJJ40800.1 hypothetical protein ASPWEDRAFT_34283 [Aspergillus wentii DTO 134E9]
MASSIDVVRITKADIPEAVECIQKAFAEDPYFKWAFNDPSKFNVDRNAASLAAHFLYGINCDAPIYVAKQTTHPTTVKSAAGLHIEYHTPRIVGVCWWYDPKPASAPEPWSVWTQEWILSFRQLLNNIRFLGRGGLNIHRYWIWKDVQKKTHDVVWKDPRGYYFCNVIAVDSGMRGMGVGRKLVEVVTDKADAEGIPCYLESSKGMPNLKIYEKLGFESVKEIECVDGGDTCKLYCMIRQPKTKA